MESRVQTLPFHSFPAPGAQDLGAGTQSSGRRRRQAGLRRADEVNGCRRPKGSPGDPLRARRPSLPKERSWRGARVLHLSFPPREPAWGAPSPPPAPLPPPPESAEPRGGPPLAPSPRAPRRDEKRLGRQGGRGRGGRGATPAAVHPPRPGPDRPRCTLRCGDPGTSAWLGRKAPRDSEGWSSQPARPPARAPLRRSSPAFAKWGGLSSEARLDPAGRGPPRPPLTCGVTLDKSSRPLPQFPNLVNKGRIS